MKLCGHIGHTHIDHWGKHRLTNRKQYRSQGRQDTPQWLWEGRGDWSIWRAGPRQTHSGWTHWGRLWSRRSTCSSCDQRSCPPTDSGDQTSAWRRTKGNLSEFNWLSDTLTATKCSADFIQYAGNVHIYKHSTHVQLKALVFPVGKVKEGVGGVSHWYAVCPVHNCAFST